jgi:threonine aldolase
MYTEIISHYAQRGVGDVHMSQPQAVSVTQETETGSVYSITELKAISQICKKNQLKLHMDGARFANALVSLDCSPAEMTWKAGVDVLSFGASKNGAMACEAVVLFDKSMSKEFEFRRKRAGHLFSKMRLLASQMETYLEGDLWLKNAWHANQMAKRLHDGLSKIEGIEVPTDIDANILFPKFPAALTEDLNSQGIEFYSDRWEEGVVRLVTAFDTPENHVDSFIAAVQKHMDT